MQDVDKITEVVPYQVRSSEQRIDYSSSTVEEVTEKKDTVVLKISYSISLKTKCTCTIDIHRNFAHHRPQLTVVRLKHWSG